ncbi:DUF6223 family protein [Streptomyces narbonensis]|uniref:DUF6223 family protein n=1 Tax=Streptomyces narbonensis TaxID=67333 RepID=UPI00167BCE26|nr:DUF6223 family protein [Streptomyces narbonensis]GGW08434.1 hypothetical protein GCM10010230_55220 [Streptomyces narbonensis]
MSVRRLLVTAAAAMLGGLVLAAPAAAHDLAQSADVEAYTLTTARFWATAAALLGLAAAVIGGLARARSVRPIGRGGKKRAIVALVAGLIALVGGVLNLAVADGGPGTGNGVVAGALALLSGLTAAILGGLALSRSRRTG